MGVALTRLGPGRKLQRAPDMNANLAVIADNLDYLLWAGWRAGGQPGGVALTLLMAINTLLALPGGIALQRAAGRGGLVRRLLFLWAEIIRGIPLMVHASSGCGIYRVLTGGDLPGAVTVTTALVYRRLGDALSVLAGLQSLPKGRYEAALTRVRSRANAAPGAAPAGAAQRSAVAGEIFIGLLKDTSLAFIVNVQALTTGPVQQPGADLSLAIFVFTGAVYYLLCCGLSLLASRRFTRRAAAKIRLTPRDGASADRYVILNLSL